MQCTGVIIDPPVLRPITGFEDTTSGIVETDAEGRFSFPAVSGDFMLIASHPTGFARVDVQDFTPSMTIRLERWSQIEGTLYVGRKPAADGVVHLDLPRFSYAREVRYRHEVRTDRAGRFVVRQVIPGWVLINYGIETQREDGATVTKSSVGHEIYVKPGETLKIKLGGTGRPVIGKLVLPADISRPAGATWGCAELHRMPPDPPKPAGYDQMTESERRQWYKQWAQTPEGQAYFKSRVEPDPNERSHLFHVDSRNLFRIEDVIPGRYQLLVPLWNLESEVPATQLVGLYFAVVEVPPIRKTYVDEPLNLGDVMLKDRPEQVPWNPPPEELVGPEISG